MVTVEDGRVLSVEHRDTDVLRWSVCNIDAAGACDAESVIERVREALRQEFDANGGLPLAVQVNISGACEAHPVLCGEVEKWVAEVRNAATEIGEVWVEKVKMQTSHQHDLAKVSFWRRRKTGGRIRGRNRNRNQQC